MEQGQVEISSLLFAGLITSLMSAVIFLYPLWRTLSRAGFHPAWSLIILVPFIWPMAVVAVFGILAFGQWPSVVGPALKTTWKALSPNSWENVTPETATQNRHYGLDGWILAFYSVSVAGTIMKLINTFNPLQTKFLQSSLGIPQGSSIVITGLTILLGIAILILVPLKRPTTPKLIIFGVWLYSLVYSAILFGTGVVSSIHFISVGSSLIFSILFTWYWLKSKRVNVTYLHRIPAP